MKKYAIALIGPSGSGKSSIGKIIADKLHCNFIDADREIERRCGRTIAEIFRHSGETEFRNLETLLLRELNSAFGRTGSVEAFQSETSANDPDRLAAGLNANESNTGGAICGLNSDERNAGGLVSGLNSDERNAGGLVSGLNANGPPSTQSTSCNCQLVLATGGGMPIFADNWKLLESMADIVYLSAPVEVLVTRIKFGEERPLLASTANPIDDTAATKEAKTRLKKLIAERESIYNRARYRIDTSQGKLEDLADDIIRLLGVI